MDDSIHIKMIQTVDKQNGNIQHKENIDHSHYKSLEPQTVKYFLIHFLFPIYVPAPSRPNIRKNKEKRSLKKEKRETERETGRGKDFGEDENSQF